MKIRFSFAAAIVVIALVSCTGGARAPQSTMPQKIPTATLTLQGGSEVHLGAGQGHVAVLTFFATWCEACRPAIAAVQRACSRDCPNGLLALAIEELDEEEGAQGASKFVHSSGPNVALAFDPGGALATQLGIDTVPTLVVVDKTDRIRYVHVGYHGEDDDAAIVREVKELLAEPAPARGASPAPAPASASAPAPAPSSSASH
jgi:peroxiredoxin